MANARFIFITKKLFRVIIAAIFLFSAYWKAVDSEQTNLFLSTIPWFPISLSAIFINVLIICEVSLALLLVIPKTQIIGTHISVIMIFVFTLILLFQSVNTTAVDCGCFGSIGSGFGLEFSIVRNVILMMMLSVTVQRHENL
jgi:hypothetical protein